MKNLKVWTCKVVVLADDLPWGFDSPPRMAAEEAIERAGFNVVMNNSGWGGKLNEDDIDYLEENGYKRGSDVYCDGLMDTPEDTQHVMAHNEALDYIAKNPTTINLLAVDDDGLFYTHSMNLSDTSFERIILKIKKYLEE